MKNDMLHDNQLRSVLFQMPAHTSGRGILVPGQKYGAALYTRIA
jgi:hypothetical protein